jgi:Tfp pilus assembly protein PilZ
VAERRRSDRYPSQLPVDIVERKGDRRIATVDVGRHGIFVRMDDPPAERLLVQLKIRLPDGPVPVLAVVARRVVAGPGRIGGAGLQFFVLAPEAKDKWDAYIGTLRGDRPASADQRTAPRRLASFLVRLKDVSRLREVYTRDISDGGLFVSTPLVRPLGSEVSLVVVHPASDEEFELVGTVARLQEGPPKGMGIRFAHFEGEEKEAFKRFMDTGVAALRWRSSAQTRPVAPVAEPVAPPGEEEEIDLGDLDGAAVGQDHGLSSIEDELARSLPVDPLDPEEAALREELDRDPSSLDPRVRLAARLLVTGHGPQALEAARDAVALDPEHPVALIGLARALARAERYPEANAAFESAKRHGHPGDANLAASIARGLGRA